MKRFGPRQDVAQGFSPAFSAALKRCATFCLFLVSMTIPAPPASAQTPPVMQIPPAAQASPSFDPTVATDAYLAVEYHEGALAKSYPIGIRVWGKDVGTWTTLKIKYSPRIIGWLTE